MSTDFPELVHVKSWNNREKAYICRKQDENYNYFITQIVHVIVFCPADIRNAWFVILVLFSKYQGFEIELNIFKTTTVYEIEKVL